MRYAYELPHITLLSDQFVEPTSTLATALEHSTVDRALIAKPVRFGELCCQFRAIWVEDTIEVDVGNWTGGKTSKCEAVSRAGSNAFNLSKPRWGLVLPCIRIAPSDNSSITL